MPTNSSGRRSGRRPYTKRAPGGRSHGRQLERHPHQVGKCIKCSYCFKLFSVDEEAKTHLTDHEDRGELPKDSWKTHFRFCCHPCPFYTIQKSNLNSHMMAHARGTTHSKHTSSKRGPALFSPPASSTSAEATAAHGEIGPVALAEVRGTDGPARQMLIMINPANATSPTEAERASGIARDGADLTVGIRSSDQNAILASVCNPQTSPFDHSFPPRLGLTRSTSGGISIIPPPEQNGSHIHHTYTPNSWDYMPGSEQNDPNGSLIPSSAQHPRYPAQPSRQSVLSLPLGLSHTQTFPNQLHGNEMVPTIYPNWDPLPYFQDEQLRDARSSPNLHIPDISTRQDTFFMKYGYPGTFYG